jgi:hypothetical protein
MISFTEVEKTILRYIRTHKTGGSTVPDFKTSKVLVSKVAWYIRHIAQWHRIENPKINPPPYSQLTFDKDAKNS